jgi:DNA topoisomerase-1
MNNAAHKAKRGIHYLTDNKLTWQRKKHGTSFKYLDEQGKSLPELDIERIKKLVIPPAWIDVRISPDEKGHIQAVGIDAKGRKQYIYHPDWIAHNQQHKFDSMVRFGEVLPVLRAQVAADMRRHSLTKERVLATVVWLLEHTFIRIGNKTYEDQNQSYGLTTLRGKHVSVEGNKVKFSFKGKSGVYHEHDITHPRIAQTIKECIEIPGYKIFNYFDDDGQKQIIDSKEVNDYLKMVTGESLSAKDFRTWGGTTLAGESLYELGSNEEPVNDKEAFTQTVEQVSQHLGNTASVCRTYYIHPTIFSSYEKKKLVPHFEKMLKKHGQGKQSQKLLPSEYAAWTLIQG